MYFDKLMRDHVLLQAVARVNPPYEDPDERSTPAGSIYDFVGIFESWSRRWPSTRKTSQASSPALSTSSAVSLR